LEGVRQCGIWYCLVGVFVCFSISYTAEVVEISYEKGYVCSVIMWYANVAVYFMKKPDREW
jgi:hypothetical protein